MQKIPNLSYWFFQNNSRLCYLLKQFFTQTVFQLLIKKTLTVFLNSDQILETYLEPCQISKMGLFSKICNGFQSLTNFAKITSGVV